MRLNNISYSPNQNLKNITTSSTPNNFNNEKTLNSQSTKNIFSSRNNIYLNESTYNTSKYKETNPNLILERNYNSNLYKTNYKINYNNMSNNLSISSSLKNINQSNGNTSYKKYQKRNYCNCKCHCCDLYCCDELLEYKINEENEKLTIKKLIRKKDNLIDENRKLKKHILILTDQNQSLINELDIIVSSSEFSTIDINHNGINHLNKIISDNRYRLEKSLDELENSINQRKNEL